ncbi:glycosyltransferase family 4 protein [Mucilaginibacter angelicae]|uniref:Glycosyltransferase family 4 protein n=1 Tax=Mucilaginibacter angelicae TaxID=869718 RepID=A0ABV6L509_9SPHI
MKIALIVNPLIPVPPRQYGGIERIVYMLIRELMKNGHDVSLYASGASDPGCRLIGYRESEVYGIGDFLKINLLTSRIAFQGFDIVHTFGRMSNIALLMPARIPKIVSYQLPPTVSQVKKAMKIAYPETLRFTGCSDYISRQIAGSAKVTTIYNGVDLSDYHFNTGLPADAPLAFLGRIQQEKGTAIAIRVARAAGRRLVIAGNIPAEPHHQQYFEKEVRPFIDGDQISYVGPVDNLQKNELLRNSAALLMPVTWDEPFGIVMAEALACGTPVVGFNRGAVPEVVTHGYNGFICREEYEMAAAVRQLSKLSRHSCREVAENKFSAAVLAGQYEQLYLEAANRH